MTGRDRIVLMVVVVAVFLVGGWMLLVSPKRKEAKTVEAKVTTAQRELASAESELKNARAAQAQYSDAYAAVVNLGKAVPASQEVASLVYQLDEASNHRGVTFNSILAGSGASGSSSPSSSSASSSSSATAAAASAGFTQMPFTFGFSGGFFALEHLFRQLTAFTVPVGSERLSVSGRLLTIQSVKLAPEAAQGSKHGALQSTVTATAYVLPAGQTVTGGATPGSPTGAAPATAASSSPTTPAIAKVAP